MAKRFKPADFQSKLNLDQLILKDQPEHDEQVPMDVLFIGAGPAGLAGAIELSKLVKNDPEMEDIEIGVLEKAESLGGHNLSGAVVNPRAMRELFPDLKDEDFPFKDKVVGEKVYLMSESGATRLPTPPTMHNKGNYTASICEVLRWMGEKAEEQGVNMFTSFPADSLLTKNGAVEGIRTTPAGLNRDGTPGSQHMPPTDVTAKVTVLTEGTRGTLTQAYLDWKKINSKYPQIYALGVKEVWRTKNPPKDVIHTLGWPLEKSVFGGSWLYPMGDDMLSIGLVAGLDYKNHNLDVHALLQQMKKHPLFAPYLEGGECIEWGAKTIPEGGFNAIPEVLHGDGLLIAGDCGGFVNVPALKGIHYAMQTGMYAARTIYEALKKQDFSASTLSSYDEKVRSSYIWSDLKKVRNMRHAFKDGFYSGGIKAGLMTITAGAFPGDGGPYEEDAEEEKVHVEGSTTPSAEGISKVDAVYLSSNKTRDDIPSHLSVGENVSEEAMDLYVSMCPAGVYEKKDGKLVVNAPNCVDCKATDVLGPRWQPREGGAGPSYRNM